jgi:hypothetical protein
MERGVDCLDDSKNLVAVSRSRLVDCFVHLLIQRMVGTNCDHAFSNFRNDTHLLLIIKSDKKFKFPLALRAITVVVTVTNIIIYQSPFA